MLTIRKALSSDHDRLWEILYPVLQQGDSFAFSPELSKEEMIGYWCDSRKHTYVVLDGPYVVASFFIQDNQPGRGSHIANAGYVVDSVQSGKGIGQFMAEYSIREAKSLGYHAMQFNLVVKSNIHAVNLWMKVGFTIIGEIPDAFDHRDNGLTNAYIMYRKL